MSESTKECTERVVYLRFQGEYPCEAITRNNMGILIQYRAAYCLRLGRLCLVQMQIGELLPIHINQLKEEQEARFWVDVAYVQAEDIDLSRTHKSVQCMDVSPCFLENVVYVADIVHCRICNDTFPVFPGQDESYQMLCPHIQWCLMCGDWSVPLELTCTTDEKCTHRTQDGVYYCSPKTPTWLSFIK